MSPDVPLELRKATESMLRIHDPVTLGGLTTAKAGLKYREIPAKHPFCLCSFGDPPDL